MTSTREPKMSTGGSIHQKRKAASQERAQANSRRKVSDFQVDLPGYPNPSSGFYEHRQRPFTQQHNQVYSVASGKDKSGPAAVGHQEERLVALYDRHRDDITFDPFTKLRSHSFSNPNHDGDVCVDEGISGGVSRCPLLRQHISSGSDNASHTMFGEDDYVFKDLGSFFNSTEDSMRSNTIQPASNGSGEGKGDLSPMGSDDSYSDYPYPTTQDSQQLRMSSPNKLVKSHKKEPKSKLKEMKKQVNKAHNPQNPQAPPQNPQAPPEQTASGEGDDRLVKNIREKKRRKGVSEKFKELYNLVCTNNKKSVRSGVDKASSAKTGRISKARMLEEAIVLIKNLETENASLTSRNNYLEYQVRQFQQISRDAALAKAASIVTPPTIMPFATTHPVNPFLFINMASLPPAHVKSRGL